MAKATFLGHGSLKFETNKGQFIYVDPFFVGDYKEPADFLLVTHGHFDHTDFSKVTLSPVCTTVMYTTALRNGEYTHFEKDGVSITAVPAYNEKHSVEECVGYIVEFDDIKVYCAGDTSTTDFMKTEMAKLKIDYAFLPIDGIYNMGPVEATACAEMIGATKGNIAIHNDPQSNKDFQYYETGLKDFTPEKKILMKHGETITL